MNLLYTKTILLSYANLENVSKQIDELMLKRALASANDFSPCEIQCENIVKLSFQKDVIYVLKLALDGIIKKLPKKDVDLLDYKYFKMRPRTFYKDFDTTSRSYFRNQVRIAKEFGDRLERIGINDEWFEENCLCAEYFSELYKRVKENERLNYKNKSKQDVQIALSLAKLSAYKEKNNVQLSTNVQKEKELIYS